MVEGGSETAPVDLNSYAVMSSFAHLTQSVRMMVFLLRMDAVDRWAVDFKEDEAQNVLEIKAFVTQLQSFLNAGGMSSLQAAPREFLKILGGMRSSRCLYLLKRASEKNEELGNQLEKLLGEATADDRLILVVRRRLESFTKAQLIGEIFSNYRLERVKSIMGVKNGKR